MSRLYSKRDENARIRPARPPALKWHTSQAPCDLVLRFKRRAVPEGDSWLILARIRSYGSIVSASSLVVCQSNIVLGLVLWTTVVPRFLGVVPACHVQPILCGVALCHQHAM